MGGRNKAYRTGSVSGYVRGGIIVFVWSSEAFDILPELETGRESM